MKNLFGCLLGCILLSGCVVPLKVPAIVPGTAEKPKIDFKRLAEFAEAAGHTYESDANIVKTYGAANVVIRNLPGSNGKYFIYFNKSDHTQTIAVRGTANKINARVDIDSLKIFDTKLGIAVHVGFKRATDELYADVTPFLKKDYKTRITGHSLGGAMACILMMELMTDGYPVDQVLTFGQPRVTNAAGGTKFLNPNYYRIINAQDLVAQVPPANLVYDFSGTYQHFGPEITLKADGTWTYSPVNIPLDFITGDHWKDLDLENGTDHQIKNYIDRILHVH